MIFVQWLYPSIYVAVYRMTSCGYIFSGVFILLNCPHVATFHLWLDLVLETAFLYWLTAVLTSVRVIHHFMSSDVTFWIFLFPCFCLTYLHIHSYQSVSCLSACHNITILVQGCCNSLIVLVIQLFNIWFVVNVLCIHIICLINT